LRYALLLKWVDEQKLLLIVIIYREVTTRECNIGVMLIKLVLLW
jgi:hypothetical protein